LSEVNSPAAGLAHQAHGFVEIDVREAVPKDSTDVVQLALVGRQGRHPADATDFQEAALE
jgi:hypothetical protein